MILSGEAGIGKSRLVADAKARARARGFLPLQGDCFEPDRVVPYAALLDLLRDFMSAHSVQETARNLSAGARDLEGLVPELAKEYPGRDYDLVAFFDFLHDMGDPVGAAKHVLRSLKPDGTWMAVEPFADERVEDNLNPLGRIFYSASTMICTPASLA